MSNSITTINNYIIQKYPKLIYGKWQLKTEQLKIIFLMVKELQLTPEKDSVTINIDELARLTNSNHKGIRSYLKEVVKGIMGQVVEIENDGEFIQCHIISNAVHTENKIKLKIDNEIKPFMINQGMNLNILWIMNMKSQYSIRLYEMLNNHFKEVEEQEMVVEYDLARLRYMLNLENKFAQVGHLNKRVLQKAKEEINKFTDILINYAFIKAGKKVIGIKFLIKKQKNEFTAAIESNVNFLDSPQLNEKPILVDSKVKIELKKMGININDPDVKAITDEKTDNDILKALKIVQQDIRSNKNIRHLKKYTLAVIRDTHYTEYEEVKEVKETKIMKNKQVIQDKEKEESIKHEKKTSKILAKYNKLSDDEKITTIEKAIAELETDQFAKQILKKFMRNELIRETDISKYDKIIQSMLITKVDEIL